MADRAGAPRLSDEEQQEKWLTEAKTVVEQQAKLMGDAIDKRALQDTLRHASQMLSELRTSNLSPQNYYELHVLVMNQLTELEMFFHEEVAGGRNVEELYEIVQHAGFIVPRLYLLITVGSVYIKTKEAPAKDILKDLVEMCKGVQHPTRGLFLRHYLSSMTKNKLPDAGNEYVGDGGTVMDSVDFVLQNLKEMVWLWVRMEQKLIIPDPERRARERKSLKVLVGLNLTSLGQLDGIDLATYVDHVMPRVVEIIMTSKGDVIAQQYLSEVMIQVFPDEFHLARLEQLLEFLTTSLCDGVDLQSILAALMERLARYTETETGEKRRKWEREALKTMFDTFNTAIANLVAAKPRALDSVKYVQTMQALLKLAIKAYPEDTDKVDTVFNTVAAHLGGQELSEKAVGLVQRMLTTPVEHYGNMQGVLDLNGWPTLLESLGIEARREVARDLVKHSLKTGDLITTAEHVAKVFEFIQPLVAGEVDQDYAEEEFEEDQLLVAKLVHLFQAEALDVQFKMLSTCRKNFGQGGEQRIAHTLPPLVFAMLKLALKVKKAKDAEQDTGKAKLEKIFSYVSGILEVLGEAGKNGALVLNMRLQAARTADKCRQPEQAAELMNDAFLCYEEQISGDSKEQMVQLPVMISTVVSMKHYDPAEADKLSGKLCAYSTKLLRKADQCRTVNICSHLFQKVEEEEKQKKVMECLQRALKLVEHCPDLLLVEILNRYVYFFSNCNPHVTSKHVNLLIELVEAKLKKDDDDEPDEATKKFYENTLKYIRTRQSKGDEGQRWQEIELSS